MKSLTTLALWLGTVGAVAIAGNAFAEEGIQRGGEHPIAPNVFDVPNGLEGSVAWYQATGAYMVKSPTSGCSYPVIALHKWAMKKNPETHQDVWVRNDKKTVTVSDGELGESTMARIKLQMPAVAAQTSALEGRDAQ